MALDIKSFAKCFVAHRSPDFLFDLAQSPAVIVPFGLYDDQLVSL
jgi:hypothetical protein